MQANNTAILKDLIAKSQTMFELLNKKKALIEAEEQLIAAGKAEYERLHQLATDQLSASLARESECNALKAEYATNFAEYMALTEQIAARNRELSAKCHPSPWI